MPPFVSPPPNILNGITATAAAQTALNVPALAGMDLVSQPGIVADLQQYMLPVTYTNGGTAVTLGNILSATVNVTTTAQGNTVLITGTQPATLASHRGHPCTVTLGNGVTWSGTILNVINSGSNQTLVLDGRGCPATVTALAGQTLSIGVQLTAADHGKLFWCTSKQTNLNNCIVGTIATVTGQNTFNLASPVSTGDSNSGVYVQTAWGTDNYAALVTAFNAAALANIPIVRVTGPIITSKWPASVDRVILRGQFPIFASFSGSIPYANTDAATPSQIVKLVIRDDAPDPQPPEPTLRGEELWAKLAGVSSPIVAFIGASTFTSDPGGAGMQSSPVRLMRNRLQKQNLGRKTFKFVDLTEGAQTIPQYANLVTRTATANWDLSYSTPWIGSPSAPTGYAYAAAPNHILLENSANDIISRPTMQAIVQIHATLNTWASPPSVTWVIDPNKAETDLGIQHAIFEHNTRWLESYCKVKGYGCINIRREYNKARDGFDPCLDVMKMTVPAKTAISNLSILTTVPTKGFTAGFTYAGTAAQFWAAAGNQMAFTLGGAVDSQDVDYTPLFRIGYDPDGTYPGGTADSIWWQVDLTFDMPGMGLPGGPVPTVLGGYSMTAASNTLTYAAADGGPASIFVPGDNGRILTIPKAGDTSASQTIQAVRGYLNTPWATAVPAPLVGYMKYVSGTQVTLWLDAAMTSTPLNAVNAISSATPQFVMRGSPRIYPGISGISTASPTSTTFKVWSIDDECGFWWQGRDDLAVRSIAVKPGMHTNLIMMLNGSPDIGNGGKLTFTTDVLTGLPDLWISDYVLCRPTGLEEEFLGQLGQTENYSAYSGPYGGSGENHPSSRINRLWQRTFNSVDWRAPT